MSEEIFLIPLISVARRRRRETSRQPSVPAEEAIELVSLAAPPRQAEPQPEVHVRVVSNTRSDTSIEVSVEIPQEVVTEHVDNIGEEKSN